MASIIRIKRSSGTAKPSSLNWGEMAYVTGVGQYGGTNQYKDRVFLGDDGTNVHPVGGHYYTSMMEHTPGALNGVTNTRNSDGGIVAVLDSSRKIDLWNVDNLTLDANTLSSTDNNGDIIFNPNGSGEVMVPDDTKLGFGGGADGTATSDATIEYDENGTDELRFAGANVKFTSSKVTVDNQLIVGGNSTLGNIRIEDNIIASLAGQGNKIFIDPYPDGLSNEGDVIIKGNLQVDGTTTAVNSTNVTVNDPIFTIGDVTSERTVMSTVAVGANQITIDSVVGINTGDTVSGSGSLPNSGLTTVTAYDTAGKTITIQGTTTAGITTQTQLTITHAYDTNTDRGIAFNYNVGVGTANAKTGFFGYVDTDSNASSSAPAGAWTYVPDGAVNNSTVSGTRGYLDIKGIYYQTADYNTGGVVYFDSNGLQTSTNAVASPVDTSKQVLTAITKITLGLPSNVTLSKGDIVKQDTSNAYGVVESAVSGGASIPLIGVEGTFVTNQNIRKEGNNGSIQNLSVIPNDVTTNYTNKPSWTSTLDGGTF